MDLSAAANGDGQTTSEAPPAVGYPSLSSYPAPSKSLVGYGSPSHDSDSSTSPDAADRHPPPPKPVIKQLSHRPSVDHSKYRHRRHSVSRSRSRSRSPPRHRSKASSTHRSGRSRSRSPSSGKHTHHHRSRRSRSRSPRRRSRSRSLRRRSRSRSPRRRSRSRSPRRRSRSRSPAHRRKSRSRSPYSKSGNRGRNSGRNSFSDRGGREYYRPQRENPIRRSNDGAKDSSSAAPAERPKPMQFVKAGDEGKSPEPVKTIADVTPASQSVSTAAPSSVSPAIAVAVAAASAAASAAAAAIMAGETACSVSSSSGVSASPTTCTTPAAPAAILQTPLQAAVSQAALTAQALANKTALPPAVRPGFPPQGMPPMNLPVPLVPGMMPPVPGGGPGVLPSPLMNLGSSSSLPPSAQAQHLAASMLRTDPQRSLQDHKKKMLWGSKKSGVGKASGAAANTTTSKVYNHATFDNNVSAEQQSKFRRMLGMRDPSGDSGKPGTIVSDSSAPVKDKQAIKEQYDKVQEDLDQQYSMSRVFTHTARGSGLGFGTSSGFPPAPSS